MNTLIQEQQRVAVGPGNAHVIRWRPTQERCGAAAAAAADAAVYR